MAVNVIDILKPKNGGAFPLVEDVDLLGGWRVVANIAAAAAIPSGKRKAGMFCYSIADAGEYVLGEDLETWTAAGGSGPTPLKLTCRLTAPAGNVFDISLATYGYLTQYRIHVDATANVSMPGGSAENIGDTYTMSADAAYKAVGGTVSMLPTAMTPLDEWADPSMVGTLIALSCDGTQGILAAATGPGLDAGTLVTVTALVTIITTASEELPA